jgi:hypothetical protein
VSILTIAPTRYIDEVQAEQEIALLFQSYQNAGEDRRRAGEELGRSLLIWRERYKAQGNHGGDRFKPLLLRLGIPRATAYRLMRRADPSFVSPETKQGCDPLREARASMVKKYHIDVHPACAVFLAFLPAEAWEAAYKTARSMAEDETIRECLDNQWAVISGGNFTAMIYEEAKQSCLVTGRMDEHRAL